MGVALSGSIALGSPAQATPSPSVQGAYQFLNDQMDLYASGSTLRLVQSFTGGTLGAQGFTDSETYDDALMVDAYLAEGTPDGLSRAELIGNALLLVQTRDPRHDGRVRVAYSPAALESLRRGRTVVHVRIRDHTSDVGNMAWVGMALAQLYQATGTVSYLAGAEKIGNWVVAHCRDTRGAGGYTGGYTGSNHRITWKSTEHNIDLYALFSMLAGESGNVAWATDASWARGFVASMWDSSTGSFFVGTLDDGVTANTSEQPEDVNSWSYLAMGDPTYASSLDWDVHNLAVTAGGFSGVSFCAGDRSGVWFEGTAHLADALARRGASGDAALAAQYLADIQKAQTSGPNTNGLGIIAASKDMLSDCDGDYYFASLHTGATAWYILASLGSNPFAL